MVKKIANKMQNIYWFSDTFSCCWIIKFLTMLMNVWAATDSLNDVMKFSPHSMALVNLGSIGIRPRKGTLPISARDSPPP